MKATNLREQLQQLHDAIEKAESVDEPGQSLLRDLDQHIRELLERSEASEPEPRPDLAVGLQDAIRHFEVTHPTLTSALSELLTGLSNAGI